MTLTRATLGTLTERETKDDLIILGHPVRIQRPTPYEYSQYQMALVDKNGEWNALNLPAAILLLTARMWIDGKGNRLFKDTETKELDSISLPFYQALSAECQKFARISEAPEVLGESEKTIVSDSPVESALNSE